MKKLSLIFSVGLLIFSLGCEFFDGPSAHWKLDEGEGTTVSDSTGNGNEGSIIGDGSIWTRGIIGDYGLEFDGVNDYVEVPFSSGIFNAQIFTAAMWLYHDNGDRVCAYFRRVGGWHMRTSNYEWGINFEGGSRVSSGYYFPDKEWRHYATVVNNEERTVSFYVDGVLFSGPYDYYSGFSDSTGDVYIGQFSGSFRWKGLIDDVRFYNGELTESEINELYLMKN